MDIYEFVNLAESWNALGTAVQEQLVSVLDGDDLEDQNANAVRLAARFLATAEKRGIDCDGWRERFEEHVAS